MSDSSDPPIEPVTRRSHEVSWSANLEYVDRCGCGGHVTRVRVDRE
ncbi:hypothetical protein [Natronolimnohabitans innermongolicus]|uniref:Uncharacterized protein n=1 Tax=Natronolimnohabitans innermongolicus JCM 12255 TaxID=1227499 RepID=L9XN81_9EURY|nr:hypothetical protein [Natronolimnohabitans innermongolicus]ELY62103.1 hypothetical protein C493_00770 [Natronolimnohabitans innermongolicus JCM 12255]